MLLMALKTTNGSFKAIICCGIRFLSIEFLLLFHLSGSYTVYVRYYNIYITRFNVSPDHYNPHSLPFITEALANLISGANS